MSQISEQSSEQSYDRLCARAEALLDVKRGSDARRFVEEAIRLEPQRIEAHVLKTRILLGTTGSSRDLWEALKSADQVVALDPEDPWGPLFQSVCHRLLDRPGHAVETARRAVELGPTEPAAFLVLAEALLHAEQPGEARLAAEEALRLNPGNPEIYDLLGRLAFHAKRFTEAEASFRKAVAADPEDAGYLNNLGLALGAQGKHKEALRLSSLALKQDPTEKTFQEHVGVSALWTILRHPLMVVWTTLLMVGLLTLYVSFRLPFLFRPSLAVVRWIAFGAAAVGAVGFLLTRRYLSSRLDQATGMLYRVIEEEMDREFRSMYQVDPEWIALGIGGAICLGWLYYAAVVLNEALIALIGLAPLVLVILGVLWFLRRRAGRDTEE